MVMKTLSALIAASCAAAAVSVVQAQGSDPSFDHQQATYKASFKPLSVQGADMELTPFFSPDHSIQTLVDLIDQAKTSLDIQTPGMSSWIGCSYGNPCIGCPAAQMTGETFPAFPALLNAVHRGVAVRIITNNYNDEVCPGKVDIATFFALNGIQIKWYQSTTFVHAKYVMVDNSLASVSSVNWSPNSFTNNREAGLLVGGAGATKALAFLTSVFDADWAAGAAFTPAQKYPPADMKIITDPAVRKVVVPEGPTNRSYVTPEPKALAGAVANFTVLTSPDWSYSTIMDMLNAATKSVQIYIYQITDPRVCDAVEALHKKAGVDVTLLVSKTIYSSYDQAAATTCYTQLDAAGLTVNMAWQYDDYMYCHNKFWIVDGTTVGISTGNMSPSDLPGSPMTFPTFSAGGSKWRDANRDFHVLVESPPVVAVFQTVLDKDLANSTVFTPGQGNDCATFGCGPYKAGQACQCNSGCDTYHNCCPDFEQICGKE